MRLVRIRRATYDVVAIADDSGDSAWSDLRAADRAMGAQSRCAGTAPRLGAREWTAERQEKMPERGGRDMGIQGVGSARALVLRQWRACGPVANPLHTLLSEAEG